MDIQQYYLARIGAALPDGIGAEIGMDSGIGAIAKERIDSIRDSISNARIVNNGARIEELQNLCQKEIVRLIADLQASWNIRDYFRKAFDRSLPDGLADEIECESPLGKLCIDRIDWSRRSADSQIPDDHQARIIDICAHDIVQLISDAKAGRHIYAYFEQAFGRKPADESFLQLPIDSECGRDCRQAIDAARSFLNFVEYAFGQHDFDEYEKTIAICEHTIECYWRG